MLIFIASIRPLFGAGRWGNKTNISLFDLFFKSLINFFSFIRTWFVIAFGIVIIGSKSEQDKFEFKELGSKSEILSLENIKSQLKKK